MEEFASQQNLLKSIADKKAARQRLRLDLARKHRGAEKNKQAKLIEENELAHLRFTRNPLIDFFLLFFISKKCFPTGLRTFQN